MHSDLQTDLYNVDSVEKNLRHSAKESFDVCDVTHSLTGHEPNDTVQRARQLPGSYAYVAPLSDQDIDGTTLGKLLTKAHREYADYRSLEGASDRTGKPVGKSNFDQFGLGVRNTYSVHNQIPANTQAEKWSIERGNTRESSCSAQRNDHRRILRENSHHGIQAARAEQERKILQEELLRQQQDFREVRRRNLTEMEEL